MKSCLHKRCQFSSFAEEAGGHQTAVSDPYDMDSDLDQGLDHPETLDSMEEDQSSFQGPEDLEESRLSPSKDTVSEDDDTKDASLALNHSPVSSQTTRNKRKNFKPRNIIYEQESQVEPNKKVDSPMDLSINNGLHQSDNEASEDEDQLHPGLPNPIPGLSVVRPEVLFGQANKLPGPGGPGGPIPPFLAPFLAASRGTENGPSIKDAFQEVLKIFGFPPELAEVFAKNAQALQRNQESQNHENPLGHLQAPSLEGKFPKKDVFN